MAAARVAVLVPWRPDGGRRDVLWAWVHRHLRACHPGWKIAMGDPPGDGTFSRSAAVNAAAGLAGDWDVAVIHDADSYVSAAALHQAVDIALARPDVLVLPYRLAALVDHPTTDQILDGRLDRVPPNGVWYDTAAAVGGIGVIHRDLWDAVGGMDPGFRSWGGEDGAFAQACHVIGAGLIRVRGTLWHLWHDPNPEMGSGSERVLANIARAQRYHDATTPDAMRALVKELGGPWVAARAPDASGLATMRPSGGTA